jgi:hypothetical protein
MPALRMRSVVLVVVFLAAALPVAGDSAEGLGLAQVTCGST